MAQWTWVEDMTDQEFEAFLRMVLAMGAEKYLRMLWEIAPDVVDDMRRTLTPEPDAA